MGRITHFYIGVALWLLASAAVSFALDHPPREGLVAEATAWGIVCALVFRKERPND